MKNNNFAIKFCIAIKKACLETETDKAKQEQLKLEINELKKQL